MSQFAKTALSRPATLLQSASRLILASAFTAMPIIFSHAHKKCLIKEKKIFKNVNVLLNQATRRLLPVSVEETSINPLMCRVKVLSRCTDTHERSYRPGVVEVDRK